MSAVNDGCGVSKLTCFLEKHMFRWALIFLIVAIIAGALGFSGLAGTAEYFARVVFVVALVLLALSFLFGRRSLP